MSEIQEEIERLEAQIEAIRIASEAVEREAAEKVKAAEKEDYLLNRGLPPLGARAHFYKYYSVDTEYHQVNDSFQCLQGDLAILDDELPKGVMSVIWRTTEDNKLSSWLSEGDLRNHILRAIRDIIDLAGLRNDLYICTEITLSLVKHHRSDIIVFRRRGSLIGVCGVKVPSDKDGIDLESLSLKSQVVDYMLQLKYTHGVENVFGIVTTYSTRSGRYAG